MRRLTILAIAAVLLVPVAGAAADDDDGRLYFGFAVGEITFDTSNPKGCESTFTTTTDTSGWAIRTGRTDMDATHCIAPYGDPGANLATVHSADTVFTARNGDQIYATHDVIVDPGMPSELGEKIVAEGTIYFESGTGRYEDATGSAYIRNVITFEGFTDPAWPARAFWIGRIDY